MRASRAASGAVLFRDLRQNVIARLELVVALVLRPPLHNVFIAITVRSSRRPTTVRTLLCMLGRLIVLLAL